MRKIFRLVLALTVVLVMMVNTGCYFFRAVSAHQYAILSKDGVSITEIVSEGRYTDNSFRADIHIIDAQGKTLTWRDNELLTSDRQTIGFEVSVTYARDINYAELMWVQYNAAAKKDDVLAELVVSRIPRVVKAVTSALTLDEMLERTNLQAQLRDMLEKEFALIGLKLLDVGVNNIRPTDSYLALLEQRATLAAEADLEQRRTTLELERLDRERTLAQQQRENEMAMAQQRTLLAAEQLLLERAQTDINLELARRENLVALEEAKVFAASPEALQIRLAEIYAGALRGTNTVYIPTDTILNIFDSGVSVAVPGR
jgi:regulator of protease activity HflC (stomatin/prohibitin superfamily)